MLHKIPPDEVDYNFSDAPYNRSKAGAALVMIGVVILILSAAGADGTAELWQIAIGAIVGTLVMGLGVAMHD